MQAADQRVLRAVIEQSWRGGVSLQSNFARKRSTYVAMAASSQLITTREDNGSFGHTWRVTSKGLRWLNETKE